LRCLTFDVRQPYCVGDTVTFVLCHRSSSSSEAAPFSPINLSNPFQFQSIIVGFDMAPVYRQERTDLLAALETAEPAELPYYEMALNCIEKLSESTGSELRLPKKASPKDPSLEEPKGKESIFYQCSDGQLLFLNSLSFRCLLHEFGGVDNLPHSITAPILDVIRVRQTEASRSRYRFACHLPLTTNYTLCDVELKTVVKRRTMAHFREELGQQAKQRARQKAHQQRDEEKMEVRGLERERELLQRSRVAYPIVGANPFGFVNVEEFGPAIGSAKPAALPPSMGGWSSVADKGLMAPKNWEPLPSRAKPLSSETANENPEKRTTTSFLEVAGAPPVPGRLSQKPKKEQSLLFSNSSNRRYKN